MRYLRYLRDGQVFNGILEENLVRETTMPFYAKGRLTGRSFPFHELELLSPVLPGKIIAVGLNYRDHIAEFGGKMPGEPILFIKPPSAVIGTSSHIIYPKITDQVDFEAELAVVLGETIRCIQPGEARTRLLGYTCGNDITARDLQARDGQWTRAKSFDSFCPLGPWIETDLDPDDLAISARVNGQTRQHSSTGRMIFDVFYLISFISQVMTLYPGDVIMTGTPSGVGPLQIGDEVEVEIEGIGVLKNNVVSS